MSRMSLGSTGSVAWRKTYEHRLLKSATTSKVPTCRNTFTFASLQYNCMAREEQSFSRQGCIPLAKQSGYAYAYEVDWSKAETLVHVLSHRINSSIHPLAHTCTHASNTVPLLWVCICQFAFSHPLLFWPAPFLLLFFFSSFRHFFFTGSGGKCTQHAVSVCRGSWFFFVLIREMCHLQPYREQKAPWSVT